MSPVVLLFAALLVVAAGVAIGATSIGGILVLPALTAVVGIDVVSAVAATSFAFLATGVLTLLDLGRAKEARAEVRRDLPLHVAALLGAAIGALLVHAVPAGWVKLWIALLALASGLHAFATLRRAAPADAAATRWPGAAALAAIGLCVGVGSGLSGTGGPILLLPVLLLLGQPLPRAVAAALVLQIPIALASTAVHVAYGRLDLRLGLLIAAGLGGGAWLGRRLARSADARRLKAATAAVLVATGIGYALA